MESRRREYCWAIVIASIASPVFAQNQAGIPLNPGERLVAINNVPVAQTLSQPRVSSGGVVQATAILPQSQPAKASQALSTSALSKANGERRRYGMRPLSPDPQLQALALRKATMAAQRGLKGHVGGSLGGASCEGVGHTTNGQFISCCLNKPGSYGGAAMVRGRDGWYCCLLVR